VDLLAAKKKYKAMHKKGDVTYGTLLGH